MYKFNLIIFIVIVLTSCSELPPKEESKEEQVFQCGVLLVSLGEIANDSATFEHFNYFYDKEEDNLFGFRGRENLSYLSICSYTNQKAILKGYNKQELPNLLAYYEIRERERFKTRENEIEIGAGYLYQVRPKDRKSYTDLEGKWIDVYVSDTTTRYGYFYIQLLSPIDMENCPSSEQVRKYRVRASKHYKSKYLEGRYEMLVPAPYKLITDEDVKRSRAKLF